MKPRKAKPAPTPGFLRFYAAYPRKVGKPTAIRAWLALGLEAKAEAVIAGLERWLPMFKATPWDKIPHPGTWLNDERWEAEVPTSHQALNGVRPIANGAHPGEKPWVAAERMARQQRDREIAEAERKAREIDAELARKAAQ